MKKIVLFALVVVLFVLVGCSASASNAVDSIEGVEGTWNRVVDKTLLCRFSNYGTYVCAPNIEKVDEGVGFNGTYLFEDGKYLDQRGVGLCPQVGTYEIFLQDNGNLKFELVEDACSFRRVDYVGTSDQEGTIEWEPFP